MEKNLKYSIFETKWGFFGILGNNNRIFRTTLPAKSYETAKRYLLVGMSKPITKDDSFYPDLHKAITDYYEGIYVDFKMLRFTLNWEELTDFSKRVLNACQSISIGQTVTYGQLAEMAGYPGAARAAGSVMAANKWPLLVGCHRVTRSDGVIGEFSGDGGSFTKKKMLKHEAQMLINKGDNNDTDKENHIGQRPCRNWPLFAGDSGGKYDLSIGPDWT